MVHLHDLVSPVDHTYLSGDGSTQISGICYDSREVLPGYGYFAIPGIHTDGHNFLPQALEKGASALIVMQDPDPNLLNQARAQKLPLVKVKNTRSALAWAASRWYNAPDDDLELIGVTGTDGKSSTVWYIHQLLEFLGQKSGFVSTVSMQTGINPEANSLRQSTPEAPEIFSLLREMADQGRSYGVIEATSHGLSAKTARLEALSFQTGVFTNISHEHLEFHGSFEQYLFDKANLFRKLKGTTTGCHGVINAQSPYAAYLARAAVQESVEGAKVLFYGLKESIPEENRQLPLALTGEHLISGSESQEIDFVYQEDHKTLGRRVTIPFPGAFNAENVMAAVLGVFGQTGISIGRILDQVPNLQGVKGRMRTVKAGQPFTVLVDYAHTPGSFEKVFPLFRQATKKRLFALFGSGGERDVLKRPIQGKIAGEFCENLYLTNEDPRLEDPREIVDQIAAGVENPHCKVTRIIDRRRAITQAFEDAEAGDTVVLLGKGHEQSIITPEGKIPWDEETVAYEVLAELGYTKGAD